MKTLSSNHQFHANVRKQTNEVLPRLLSLYINIFFAVEAPFKEMAEFVKSSKGKPMLLLNGYLFVKDKSVENKTYWKCKDFENKCKSRTITIENEVKKEPKQHNHAGDPESVEVFRFMEDVKDKAKNSREAPHVIISDVASQVSQAAAVALPTTSSIKRTVRRVRQKEDIGLVMPLHRRDLVFTDDQTKTNNGDPFLMFDSGASDDRILIFSTARNLQVLSTCRHLYADGTFKTVPSIFEQLYTVHGVKNGLTIPLIYALLPNKREQTYIEVWKEIKVLAPNLAIDSILIDFEPGMINAIKKEFPQSANYGCFFHFCQCIYRKLCACGLKSLYDTDAEFALNIRMLSALAFLPPNRVVEGFNLLIDENIIPGEADSVLDYFEDNWIGRPDRRGRRRAPKYNVDMWSCFERVEKDLPKTNNSVEGWHRGFLQQVSSYHPSIWKFLSALKREQSLNEVNLERINSGFEFQKISKKYKASTDRLKNLVSSFDDSTDIIDYLRGISHNLKF